jgi:hypothetical protein
MRRYLPPALACLAVVLSGCGKRPPAFTEVEGVVLLNGKELPNALVTFVPMLTDFGAEMNSTAVTTKEGRFILQCPGQSRDGAVVGKHRVLVTEAPVPREFRGIDRDHQEGYANYLAGLKNRPIPDRYGTMAGTDLEVDVEPGAGPIELRLKRP